MREITRKAKEMANNYLRKHNLDSMGGYSHSFDLGSKSGKYRVWSGSRGWKNGHRKMFDIAKKDIDYFLCLLMKPVILWNRAKYEGATKSFLPQQVSERFEVRKLEDLEGAISKLECMVPQGHHISGLEINRDYNTPVFMRVYWKDKKLSDCLLKQPPTSFFL